MHLQSACHLSRSQLGEPVKLLIAVKMPIPSKSELGGTHIPLRSLLLIYSHVPPQAPWLEAYPGIRCQHSRLQACKLISF